MVQFFKYLKRVQIDSVMQKFKLIQLESECEHKLAQQLNQRRNRVTPKNTIPIFANRNQNQTVIAMWATSMCVLLLGLASCCVSLPEIQYVNEKPYYLMQSTECRGGKLYEINQVQDIDECKAACLHRNCKAVNLFQVGEFEFKCEILDYVRSYYPAQGAACYISY